MKFNTLKLALALGLAFCASFASADAVYPYQNPTYIPNAISAPASYTAPGSYLFTTNGVGTVTVRVSGTCTSLAATLKASNDGTNFTNINLYPIATGTVAPTAVAAVSLISPVEVFPMPDMPMGTESNMLITAMVLLALKSEVALPPRPVDTAQKALEKLFHRNSNKS